MTAPVLHASNSRQTSSLVFGIAELLESILVPLDFHEILRFRGISRAWKACIARSAPLQEKLFLQARPSLKAWMITLSSIDLRVLNRMADNNDLRHTSAGRSAFPTTYDWLGHWSNTHMNRESTQYLQHECLGLTAKQFNLPKRLPGLEGRLLLPVIPNKMVLSNIDVVNGMCDYHTRRSINEAQIDGDFELPATFTVPECHAQGVGLDWRWMFLTNPPCKEVVVWPFPATLDTILGKATIDSEQARAGESSVVYNQAGVKVRDILRVLEGDRALVPPGADFRIRLKGIMPMLDSDCMSISTASALELPYVPRVSSGVPPKRPGELPAWDALWLMFHDTKHDE